MRLPSHRAPLNIGDYSPISNGHGPKFQHTDKFRRKWKKKNEIQHKTKTKKRRINSKRIVPER